MDFQFSSMLLLITIASLALAIKQKSKKVGARRQLLPPSPWKLPLIGNLHQLLGSMPHKSIQQLSRKYGPLMYLQLGPVPTLVVSSADAARAIFKPHDVAFSRRPNLYAFKKLTYDFNSISFAPYPTLWRELRKIAVHELLGSKTAQSFRAAREEEVAIMVGHIADLASESGSGPVNLSQLLLGLTSNVICRTTLGKSHKNIGANTTTRFCNALHEALAISKEFAILDLFPWLGWVSKLNGLEARAKEKLEEIDKFYDRVIEDHLHPLNPIDEDDQDMVDLLLQVQNNPSRSIALTNQQVKGFLAEMFIGGIDTIATTLVWTFTELIKNPSTMERAQAEVRQVAKGRGRVDEADLPKLTYLKSVIKEALRLHPPLPISLPRETAHDCMVGDYTIPAKTTVLVDIKSIGTDPKYWENPNEFRPDRFLNSFVDFKGQHFELLPFGIGRRSCPGTSFAILLVQLALANLLHRFDWELPSGMSIEDVDTGEEFEIRLVKKTPLRLVARAIPGY